MEDPRIDKFLLRVNKSGPVVRKGLGSCWLWQGKPSSCGYGIAWCEERTDGVRQVKAHRRSYNLFIGEIPDGLCVLHHCDVRLCVNPEHLYAGTRLENSRDMDRRGRRARHLGELHGMSHLTNQNVLDIRSRVASGELQLSLAKEFKVGTATICRIVNRKVWRHI